MIIHLFKSEQLKPLQHLFMNVEIMKATAVGLQQSTLNDMSAKK